MIWLAYNEKQGGLARLDPGTNELKHYPLLLQGDEETWPGVRTIYEDADGNLWLGTIRAGLYKLDREHQQLIRYRSVSTDPATLASNEITALFEDREGGVWVGTRGDGADRFARKPLLWGPGLIRTRRERSLSLSSPQNPQAWAWDSPLAVQSCRAMGDGYGLPAMTAQARFATSTFRSTTNKDHMQESGQYKAVIAIGDDDPSVRRGLQRLIRSAGWVTRRSRRSVASDRS